MDPYLKYKNYRPTWVDRHGELFATIMTVVLVGALVSLFIVLMVARIRHPPFQEKRMHTVKLILDYTTNPPDPEYAKALKEGNVIEAKLLEVAGVPDGTEAGKPSVGFISQLPDGQYVWTETTLKMLQTLVAGLNGKYGVQ